MNISTQMEEFLKEWKEEHIHDDCEDCDDDCEGYDYKLGEQDLEEFFLEYTNSDNSIMYYDISDEDLDNSYREGSLWIIERLVDEYGMDSEDIMKTLKKMSKDNKEYAIQLIYFIGCEL